MKTSLNLLIPAKHESYILPFSRFLSLVAEFLVCFVSRNKFDPRTVDDNGHLLVAIVIVTVIAAFA